MNILKVECSRNDYVIKTALNTNGENELVVEIPEEWNRDYVNVVLWEDDICEIFENNDEQILLIPKCGELLLRKIRTDVEKQFISIPLRYEDQEILILKI